MQDIQIYGLKNAQGSSSAFPIPLNVDDKILVSPTGIVRNTNPTAIADTGEIQPSYDDLGRQLITPYQVRDLISTAQATLTRVSETTILAGVASTLLDIVSITGANTSTNALRVDIRTGTGGTVVESLVVPAGGTVARDYLVPLPQSEVAQAWTGKVNVSGEVSDDPVSITIVAVKNI